MKPDFQLLIQDESISFEFDTIKKHEIAEVLIDFFKENKGIAVYFQTCLRAAKEDGIGYFE